MPAGQLRDRIAFFKRAIVDDGMGNEVAGPWTRQFDRAAQILPMKGGETVIASRLEGVQPVIIVVRFDSQTSTITPDWMCGDARAGFKPDGTPVVQYAIHTAADMDRRRQWWTMMAQEGVAP